MDDLISRQALLKQIEIDSEGTLGSYGDNWQFINTIRKMPSADRPSGHWVLINRGLDIYMCDRCGEILQIDSVPIWDYCPVCGARMGGETDGRPNQQTGGD